MSLLAGAATRDISPQGPVPLCGYPKVKRISTGIHDPLLAAALYLQNGDAAVLLCSLDLLMLNTDGARRLRSRVAAYLGIPEAEVLISCTHTHSGPVSMRYLPWRDDPALPAPDPQYLEFVQASVVEAAQEARQNARPARLDWATANARGVGGNRHSPDGPVDPEAGILIVRLDNQPLALSLVYGMHPTVLHEDSTLVSADFPCYARQHLQEALGHELVVLYHTGPCGDQSPRYFVSGQTFAEAERLGRRLGEAVAGALTAAPGSSSPALAGRLGRVDLPRRRFPSVVEAEALLEARRREYEQLRTEGAERARVRTAEVSIFGAEGALNLARAQGSGELDRVLAEALPAEVQVVRIGAACIVGLPGEIFVEYALELKRRAAMRTFLTSYTNGELQGYIVTPEAAAAGGYEAAGSLFEPHAGEVLVNAALDLIRSTAR